MPRVIDDQLLNEVARRILTVVQPDRIILFGSAASGSFRATRGERLEHGESDPHLVEITFVQG